MIFLIFLIIGLAVGSFLNVLVYRLHTAEEMISSRSKCPHCQNLIHWYDNIPVLSFILLKSRCRDCKQKISWQYPLVEIATGLLFALIGWKFFSAESIESWISTVFYLFIVSSLITIFIYDWLYMEIPSPVLWVSIFITFVFNLWTGYTYGGDLAALAAFTFFFCLSFFSKEKWMGMGDAYLVILLGLFLGWPQILLAVFLSFLLGSVYGITLILLKLKDIKSAVPFAPFLILGTFIAWFFYEPIIYWYFGLFI